MNALIATLQVLIALAFVSIPVIRARWGADAQAAAEAELTRQGVPATVLAENKLRFDAGGHETAAPVGIAAVLVALAALNVFGTSLGEPLTWWLQPLIILVNGAILYSQLTAVRAVEGAFAKKGDPLLARVDVPAFLTAAEKAFPSWVFPGAQNLRHTIAFAGSAAILILLALN
jgi:hypothetical protein